jgi:hypothetical protein
MELVKEQIKEFILAIDTFFLEANEIIDDENRH